MNSMIYLLYGEDTYRSWHKLLTIKSKYLDTSMGDTDLATLEGAELTAADFSLQTQTLPFLAKSRLVIVKNLIKEGKKETTEAIIDELSKIPATTVIFFYEAGQPDRRTKLFQTLNKPKQAQEFPLLVGSQLTQHLIRLAKQRQLNLPPAIAQKIVALLGSDLWLIDHELAKLSLYKTNQPGPVTETDIMLLIAGTPETKIFDLTDAFGNRDPKTALRLLNQMNPEESELGLLAMIAGHYRNLLLIADGQAKNLPRPQLAATLKLHPFVFDKTFSQARRYDYNELVNCYRFLFQLDLAAKQSLIEPLTGLTVLAGSLADKQLNLPDLTEETML